MIGSTKTARFQALALPHLDAAFNLARWLTHNPQSAEDVVQEAYLRAFKFFDSLRGEDARSWLLAIVRNTFHSWYRENHAHSENVLFDEEMHSAETLDCTGMAYDDNNPETMLMHKDSERQLQQALAALPVQFREVIVLRELEDLSYKQISIVVGVPIGTVMSRLGRGRKLLAKSLMASNPEA